MGRRRADLVTLGAPTLVALAVWLAVLVTGMWDVSSTVRAQTATAVGSAGCAGQECHTKSGEIDWLTAKPGGRGHRNSLGKLRQSRDTSEKYAKSVGLTAFDEPNGMCVKCHATYVDKARTLEGVGCESCHGPASGYREFHSNNPKDARGAIGRGMRDIFSKPSVWINACRGCHVLDNKPEYADLLDAGHKDGARWNPSKQYVDIQTHWTTTPTSYTTAEIAAAAAGQPVTARAVSPNPLPAPIVAPPAPPTPEGGAPRVAGPPLGPLPAVRGNGAPLRNGAAATRGAIAPKAAMRSALGAADTLTPAAAPSPGAITSPLGLQPPAPATAAGLMAALQDGVAGLLERLLRSGVAFQIPQKPTPSPPIDGPDGEFLQLQNEVVSLAIEALNLRTRPATPSRPK